MPQVIIDASTWGQSEKNLTKAASVSLLHTNNITYDSIVVSLPIIIVENNSADIIPILTSIAIKNEIDVIMIAANTANAEAEAENNARESEMSTNEFANIKLVNVNARIDQISNLSELKVALKKICRFVVSRRQF